MGCVGQPLNFAGDILNHDLFVPKENNASLIRTSKKRIHGDYTAR